MADYTPLHPAGLLATTSTASAAVSGGDLLAVSGTGTVGPASQGGRVVGVAAHDAGTGVRVTVHPLAGVVHELVAGSGGVTAGQVVMAGADPAEVLPLAEGSVPVGVALTTASGAAKVQVLGTAAGGGAAPVASLSGSAALNFDEVAAGDQEELTITVTGAAVGDAVALAPPATLTAGLVWSGRVSAANTVTVRLANVTAAPVDPASATWGALVFPAA